MTFVQAYQCNIEDDGSICINYSVEQCRNNEGKVVSYYIHTDSGYEFSFNAYEDDTVGYVLELAETLIKSEWFDENV